MKSLRTSAAAQRRGTTSTYETHAEHPHAPLAVLRRGVHCVHTDVGARLGRTPGWRP